MIFQMCQKAIYLSKRLKMIFQRCQKAILWSKGLKIF